jgi:hypothetical protein
MSNGGQQQRSSYVESHAVAHAALQQHMAQQAAQARLTGPGLPAAPQPPNPTFTLPDDGLGYDDGVRVLRSIGTWCVKYIDSSMTGHAFRSCRNRFFVEVAFLANAVFQRQ